MLFCVSAAHAAILTGHDTNEWCESLLRYNVVQKDVPQLTSGSISLKLSYYSRPLAPFVTILP
jgi:hypothetical protein